MSAPTPDSEFPPVITTEPQVSLRAILTGAILGGALAMANIYTGLKIGWGFNMSITAALLAFGLWTVIGALDKKMRRFSMLENNLNQTGASAAASISSAGLVSAVPALTMLNGHDWSYPELAIWIFCCSGLGVFVAVLFRRQMLVQEKLPFASGIASAETLKEMYARGAEAMARVKALLYGAGAAAFWKLAVQFAHIKALAFAGPSLPLSGDGAAAKVGVTSLSAGHVAFALDPSLLMVGAGAIIGVRIGTWMLVGAIASWFLIGGYVIDQGWVAVSVKEVANVLKIGGTEVWTIPVKNVLVGANPGPWLLWPGVALLVTSSLAALAWAAPQFVRAFRGSKGASAPVDRTHDVPRAWLWGGVAFMTALTLIAGHVFFGMHPLVGLTAVALTGILAVVALRVSGETNVTPVGPMGKVTQLAFGV
ncbi:MAG: OPT/YSL family transporter, partial [Deltaproteobacteria bacterium]|nr:OPT/YSL family transporter [Deltaproteobacteria bacterium]